MRNVLSDAQVSVAGVPLDGLTGQKMTFALSCLALRDNVVAKVKDAIKHLK